MLSDVYFMIAQLEREELLRKKKHMYWRHPSYQMGKRPPGLFRRSWNAMVAALFGPPSKATIDQRVSSADQSITAAGSDSGSTIILRRDSRYLPNS